MVTRVRIWIRGDEATHDWLNICLSCEPRTFVCGPDTLAGAFSQHGSLWAVGLLTYQVTGPQEGFSKAGGRILIVLRSLEKSPSVIFTMLHWKHRGHQIQKKTQDPLQWKSIKNWGPNIKIVAAAKSLQSCPTLCDPIDGGPPGSPVPGILQARTLEWVAISFSNAWKWKVKVKSFSRVRLLATPWTAAYQVPLSMGFSRQEYWSGVPLPSPLHLVAWL